MHKAVIFDMDGVISDTQQFHSLVEAEILKRIGIIVTPEKLARKYSGVSDEEMFAQILKENNKQARLIDQIIIEKWNMMGKVIKGKITAIPSVINFIKLLKKQNHKLAIASASTKLFIDEVTSTLNIQNDFDVIVSSQEVAYGKPAPDIFLLALKRLNVKPENAIVIEDGKSGMIGAKKAHIKCIGLVKDVKQSFPADLLITSFNQINMTTINNLLKE